MAAWRGIGDIGRRMRVNGMVSTAASAASKRKYGGVAAKWRKISSAWRHRCISIEKRRHESEAAS